MFNLTWFDSFGLFAKKRKEKSERVVIIHNHLFKNAGTTIDFALCRNFGEGFVDHRDDDNMRKGAAYLGPYLSENPWIRAVSTHHLTLPLPSLDKVLLPQIVMLRDPIERVTSVYNFERKQTEATTPGAMFATQHDLKEYVKWRMNPDVGNTIRNFYISRCLPPRQFKKRPFTAEEFERACAFLRSVPLLGLVERFNESMVLMEEFLREYIPGIDLSYIPQNVGQKRKSAGERREFLKQELGEELFQELHEKNREDIALYKLGKSLVQSRIDKVDDLDAKLQDFRNRCARLVAA
ncbi:sulfotransferase family 2 domain-containing protein [Desulfolithobacter sp.]